MGLITIVGDLLYAIAVSALGKVSADEAKAWMPRLTDLLIEAAARRLPDGDRERYREEWRSHVLEVPGDVSKLVAAAGFIVAARQIRAISAPAVGAKLTVRALEVAVGVTLLPSLAPLLLLVALVVRRDGGPIFTREPLPGSEKLGLLQFRTKGKDGATSDLGRVLETSSLHSVPGVIDLIRGRASLNRATGKRSIFTAK